MVRTEAMKKAQRKYRLKTQHGEVYQANERKRNVIRYAMNRNYRKLDGDWSQSFSILYGE